MRVGGLLLDSQNSHRKLLVDETTKVIVRSILSAALFIVIREKDELSGLNTYCRPRVGSSSIEMSICR